MGVVWCGVGPWGIPRVVVLPRVVVAGACVPGCRVPGSSLPVSSSPGSSLGCRRGRGCGSRPQSARVWSSAEYPCGAGCCCSGPRRRRGRGLAVDLREDSGLGRVVFAERAVIASPAAVSLSPKWFQNWLFWVFQSRWALTSVRSAGCCGGWSPACLVNCWFAVFALRTANRGLVERTGAVAHLVGPVGHLLRRVGEGLARRLGALTAEPVVGADLGSTASRSWLANRRSRLSPVVHCCPAVSRGSSFAFVT